MRLLAFRKRLKYNTVKRTGTLAKNVRVKRSFVFEKSFQQIVTHILCKAFFEHTGRLRIIPHSLPVTVKYSVDSVLL